MKRYLLSLVLLIAASITMCFGQQQHINLSQALKENKLAAPGNNTVTAIDDNGKQGVSINGLVWLKDVNFTTGSIDVDIKGRDVYQQSFLGIAFHGLDTTNFDVVYFRPFNFRATDSLRRIHQVQYVSEPNFPWEKLRSEHPGVYEKGISPILNPADWLHAHIVVTADDIAVYVNNATTPSLKVKKLNNRTGGLLGLWTFGLNGDFANLVIGK